MRRARTLRMRRRRREGGARDLRVRAGGTCLRFEAHGVGERASPAVTGALRVSPSLVRLANLPFCLKIVTESRRQRRLRLRRIKMQETEKELIAKMLRAVLQSNKNGVVLSRVQGEYKSLTGDWIPFKQLGYPTLESYLRSIPMVVRVEANRSGEVVCSAVACTETAQIAKLVARQRTAKKNIGKQVNCQMRIKRTTPFMLVGKPKGTLRQPGFSYQTERFDKKPIFTLSRSRGGYIGFGKHIYEIAHTAVIPNPGTGESRELLMQGHTSVVRRPEKITLPPRFQKDLQMQLPRNPPTDANANLNVTSPEKSSVPVGPHSMNTGMVQNNIKEILQKYSNGIWLSKLPHIYKNAYKQDLNEDIIKQLKNWPQACMVEKVCRDGHKDVLLYPPVNISVSVKHGTNQENSVLPVSSQQDTVIKPLISSNKLSSTCELKQRVKEILLKYSNGLWANALPKVFEDTFKVKFPEDVLQNLDLLADVCTVDYVSDNPQKAILYTKVKPSIDENRNDANRVCIRDDLKLMVEEEYSRMTEDNLPFIPSLVIPNEASQSVLVVDLNNTNEVVIRYVGEGYSIAHEHMEDEMKEYYRQNAGSTSIQTVKVGQLVAINAEEDAWLRARIVSITADKLEAYYVDYGFSETIARNKIRSLGRPFYSLPFQATKCRLAGLEAFCEDRNLVKAVATKACEKILAVEILEKSEIPLVVLYDTSGVDDININASCLKELYDKSLQLTVKDNILFTNVRVANVCSDGTLFCQVPSKGLAKLYEVLQKIENYFHSKATSEFFVSLPFCGKICLMNCKEQWARVEITNLHSSRTLDVQFLDFGMVASVKVSELREIPLQFLKEAVTIPPQALKCCLADLPHNIGMWTPDAVLWLRDTVLNSSDCSIKVTNMDKSKGMVYIYLFTSKNVSDLSCSINRQITNADLWKHRKDVLLTVNPCGNSLTKSKENDVHAPPGLAIIEPQKDFSNIMEKPFPVQSNAIDLPPLLPLPKPGEHLDVYVSVACHPAHFVVQPWQVLHNLEAVMEEMILYYSTTEECLVDVEKNKVYAAKIENKWYRVLLKGILTNGLVSVYELDYGRHELVSCRKVQPLIDRFKLLPFQAVRAELAGVKCEQWSEEASIVFRNHVEKKPLVALIQAVYENTNPWDRKLVAYIVDTSLPDTDVWIHDLMAEYLAELSKAQ
ncbi:tudor domain-containing protein 7 isoform X2 [Rhinatrema bivittatum]|uniref:tudor domain-containing protein 7 isoform X2 n=1 Tax=Rhinatrema bivittatum TaxID=194408 RepID=UPI001129BAD5|nr:tudor domain-containing protein 7 isoform X2 [Rhinatrema bivittatum]